MPPKRKAVDDPQAHWVPTVPAPSTSRYPYASSQGYGASSSNSQPAAKKARKAKDPSAPAPEKRGAIFKKACPKAILERAERVAVQRCATATRFSTRNEADVPSPPVRFFMIDREREGNELKEEFSVLGSTGNVSLRRHSRLCGSCKWLTSFTKVYKVVIDKKPSCTCEFKATISRGVCAKVAICRSRRAKGESLQAYREFLLSPIRRALLTTSFSFSYS